MLPRLVQTVLFCIYKHLTFQLLVLEPFPLVVCVKLPSTHLTGPISECSLAAPFQLDPPFWPSSFLSFIRCLLGSFAAFVKSKNEINFISICRSL